MNSFLLGISIITRRKESDMRLLLTVLFIILFPSLSILLGILCIFLIIIVMCTE